MTTIVTIAPNSVIPRRLDGIVTSSKDTISIEYKEKGMVKSKTKSYPSADLIAYQVGAPGFVVERSAEAVATIVGSATSSGVKNENGTVVINPNAAMLGAVISRQEVDDDSREARVAARAGKGEKVKIKTRDVAGKKTRKTEKADRPEKSGKKVKKVKKAR